MKVLISWSGPKSEALALALHEWIKSVLHMVEPWMSKQDIDMGIRWGSKLAQQLEETKFGIICLTQENLNSPWVLFEAGALSKTKDTNVCPYLLDLEPSDIGGPLKHYFQCAKANEADTRKLIHSINHSLGKKALKEELVNRSFDKFWPDLDLSIKEISRIPSKSEKPLLTLDDKVDELLRTNQTIFRIISDLKSSIQLNDEISQKIFLEDSLSTFCKNIEQNEKLLGGYGESIKQGERTAQIGDWIIFEYTIIDSKKISKKGRATLLGGNPPRPGNAIANLKMINSIESYDIKIERIDSEEKEKMIAYFSLLKKV